MFSRENKQYLNIQLKLNPLIRTLNSSDLSDLTKL